MHNVNRDVEFKNVEVDDVLSHFSSSLIERTKRAFDGQDPAHDWAHNLRVLLLAERIGQEEQADMTLLRYATLLHDIGRAEERRTGECHAEISARWAVQWLEEEGISATLSEHGHDKLDAIQRAIRAHRFRKDQPPTTLEEKILFDSDKLDSIGAIGVARAFVYSGVINQSIQRFGEEEGHTPLQEFEFKLRKLKDRLYTRTARQIAEERHQFMVQFFERYEKELLGSM
ncbi:HD domain-containing protein [Caldalkalibacillus salinus]|uniref:HD domain-containing protein n=1 Tax=Caldalkalibacillus salinus TaxID=2803787 RepID=UPI0019225A6F|nr:HD domain-containing protein [Caldalkalibacillus salinus]